MVSTAPFAKWEWFGVERDGEEEKLLGGTEKQLPQLKRSFLGSPLGGGPFEIRWVSIGLDFHGLL